MNVDFYNFYRGIKACRAGNLKQAIRYFRRSENSVLCRDLYEYFQSNFKTTEQGVAEALYVWPRTSLALKETRWTKCIYGRLLREGVSPVSFVDLGCGDGRLAVEIIRLLFLKRNNPLKQVILVDKDRNVLEKAAERIRAEFALEIRTIAIDIRRLDFSLLNMDKDRTLVNICSVFHELNFEEKNRMLKVLRQYFSKVLIAELFSNHSIRSQNNKDLFSYVYRFYNGLLKDAYFHSSLSEKEAQSYSFNYLLPEVLDILTKSYRERINHHLLEPQWRALLSKYWQVQSFPITIHPDLPDFGIYYLF